MLVICVSCFKVIGCTTKKTKIENDCLTCNAYNDCKDAIPAGTQGELTVLFVHFEKGCLAHNRTLIGFHKN